MKRRNNYSKIMSLESNTQLESIIANKEKYTDDAIKAVIWELEKRGLREKSKEEVEKKDVTIITKIENPALESHFDEFEVPILYSKKSIQGFSIFFGTIFGAFLLMFNLSSLNKSKERLYVLLFGIVYTLLTYFVLYFIASPFFVTIILNIIGFGILNEFFWNTYLGKDINHKKKRITKPLIISLLIMSFFIFLQFIPIIFDVPV